MFEQLNIDFGYRPLTFIKRDDEIMNQIQNTIVMKHILGKYGKLIPLKDVLEKTQYGYTASAKNNGNCRFLRITDIKEGKVDWETMPFCECDCLEKYILRRNDILIARTGGTTGKSYLVESVDHEAVFASYLIRLTVNPGNNPFFVYSFLNSYLFWSQILQMKNGTAQPNVNAEKMKGILIPICPLDVQDRIAEYIKEKKIGDEFIGGIASEIERINISVNSSKELDLELDHQLSLLKKLRQAVLQEAVEGKLTADWRARNPEKVTGENSAERLLESIREEKERLVSAKKFRNSPKIENSKTLPKNSIPTQWQWTKGDDIFWVTKLAGFEYTKYVRLSEKGEIPVVRAQNIRPLNILKDNVLYIDSETSNFLKRSALTKSCLLVTFIGAGIGDVALFDEEERWHLAPNVAKMELYSDVHPLDLKYINYFLMSPIGSAELRKHIKATAQPSLSMGTIRDIDYPIPPIEEQKVIVERVERILAMVDELEGQVGERKEFARQMMQSVLKEAFNHRT